MTQQITPLKTQKVLDLCSGIGGFTLGHKICGGFETVAFCEINSYCQQLLHLRFPNIPIIRDIHDITTESLAGVGVTEVALPDSPALPLASPENSLPPRMSATCSVSSLESFARFDQHGNCGKRTRTHYC
ncbi:MAG: DNA cytosine methyltransferase [Nostoc sp.]